MTTASCLMLQDTMVICNFNGTLMNKDIWGDPDVFRPDRFIDLQGSIVIPDQYTPFGFGKLLPSYSGSDMCTFLILRYMWFFACYLMTLSVVKLYSIE
jgi:hypothetical protein